MSDSPDALAQQIAELEASLKLSLPDSVRRPLEAELARLCAAHPHGSLALPPGYLAT